MSRMIKIVNFTILFLIVKATLALAANQVYFYQTDPAGTPITMSDETGTVVWESDYMPFGEELPKGMPMIVTHISRPPKIPMAKRSSATSR